MKRSLRMKIMLLLFALVVGCSNVWAEDETLDFSEQGYTNGQTVSQTKGTVIQADFTDGGTATAYYDTGSAIRVYNGGTMTISASGNEITEIVYTYELNGNATVTIAGSTNTGTFNSSTKIWTGSDTGVVLTAGTAKHVRISAVEVTYTAPGGDPCTITLISNGMTTTVNATQGVAYDFPTPSNVPSGYAYRGWSTKNEGIAAGDVKSSFTPDASTAIYYAAYTTVTYTYEEVTSLSNIVDGEYVITAISGTTPYTLKNAAALAGKVNAYELEELSLTISSTTLSGDVSDVIWTFFGDNTNGFTVTSGNKYLYATSTNNGMCVGGTSDKWKFSNTSKSKAFYMRDTNQSRYLSLYVDTPNWRCYTGTGNGVPSLTLYKKTPDYGSSYVATIADPSIPGNVSVATATEISTSQTFEGNLTITAPLTISGTAVVTVTGTITNTSASNLIIESGAQLIANSVLATVKKTITDPSKDGDYGHWYTISTPVHKDGENHVVISGTNLISMAPDYDMFYLDEATGKWMNQKETHEDPEDPTSTLLSAGFANMNIGQGYLYRNDGTDLVITGKTNAGDEITYTLTKTGSTAISGFNLIGNPFPHNIYKGTGTAIPNSVSEGYVLASGFYTLTDEGAWHSCTDNTTPIAPYQGVLVQATKAGTITFTDTDAIGSGGSKSNNDNIKFMVSNSQYEDVTYALFDKGFGLTKIDHRNANIPMLYINQDGENFAIATMSDDTKSFNLNFKAKTTGKYTLSYKANGQFNYLHIIDRLTGEDVDMLLDGQYSFIASPNDSDARFIVKLNYDGGSAISENEIFAFQNGNDIYVTGNGELQIFDITGRRVMTTTINGAESISIPAQGVYIFKLNEKVQKIVVE